MESSAARRVSLFAATLLMLALSVTGLGQVGERRKPYELKALWIEAFAEYTEWLTGAPDTNVSYRLLLIGRFEDQADFKRLLNSYDIKGRPLAVDTRKSVDSKKDLEGYQIVVISRDVPTGFIQEILDDLRGTSVLTVGEEEGFTNKGGVLSLVIRGDEIFLEVNRASATSAKLRIREDFLETIKPRLLIPKR